MDHTALEVSALYYKALDCYEKNTPESRDEGYMFLRQAAQQGMPEAMKLLGTLEMSGQYDPFPEKNMEDAVSWYRQAAENGDAEAMYFLSCCYATGNGLPLNKREARKWRQKAKAAGYFDDEDETSSRYTYRVQDEEENETGSENEKQASEQNSQDHQLTLEGLETPPSAQGMKTFEPQSWPEASSSDTEKAEKTEKTEEEKIKETEKTEDIDKTEKQRQADSEQNPAKSEKSDKSDQPDRSSQKEIPVSRSQHEDDKALASAIDETRIRQMNSQTRNRIIFKNILIMVLIAAGFMLFLFLVLHRSLDTSAKQQIFAVITVVVMIAFGMLGYISCRREAADTVKRQEQYLRSAFCQNFGALPGHLSTQQAWWYKQYLSLERVYLPVSTRAMPGLEKVRQYRGALFPGWEFGEGSDNRPEFVVLTDRAVYVVLSRYLTGKLEGEYQDVEWKHTARDGSVHSVGNMFMKNSLQTLALKKELLKYVSSQELTKVPFFSIVCLNQDVDTDGLLFSLASQENILFLTGGVEKLRTALGAMESELHTDNVSMEHMLNGFEQIGASWLHSQMQQYRSQHNQ